MPLISLDRPERLGATSALKRVSLGVLLYMLPQLVTRAKGKCANWTRNVLLGLQMMELLKSSPRDNTCSQIEGLIKQMFYLKVFDLRPHYTKMRLIHFLYQRTRRCSSITWLLAESILENWELQNEQVNLLEDDEYVWRPENTSTVCASLSFGILPVVTHLSRADCANSSLKQEYIHCVLAPKNDL